MSWTELALIESHDIVRERFAVVHGREVPAGKVAEITAFFTQGRQYFEAAASSGPLVAPLLYYYGVNAICRGAVLFLDPQLRQASLKASHGLTIHDWQRNLSDGIHRLPNLEIQLEPTGTFPELVRVASDRLRVPAFRDDFTMEQLNLRTSSVLQAGIKVSVAEILSRLPDLNELFEEVANEPSNIFSVGIKTFAQSRRTRLDVYGSLRFPLDDSRLRTLLPEPTTSKSEPLRQASDLRPAVTFWIPPEQDGGIGKLPPLRYSHGGTWLVMPFDESVNLPPVAIHYLFAFVVGMLSRYFPQHWLALRSGQRGDRFYPLIREAIEIVARRFPGEMATALFD